MNKDSMIIGLDKFMDVQLVFNERLRGAITDAIANVKPGVVTVLAADTAGHDLYVLRRSDLEELINRITSSQAGEPEECNDESPSNRAAKPI